MRAPTDGDTPKHRPQNRQMSESKRRRDGRHCPVCLAPLKKIAGRTRLRRECVECGAHPSEQKTCRKCGGDALWESKRGVACQACGSHGTKALLISPR
jgi:hypothetical protein